LLSDYACSLRYTDLSPEAVHQVKRTLIDTLGCAMGGFHAEPSVVARRLAGRVTSTLPARVLGTRTTSSPELAGFANGVMVRYLDCSDSYIARGSGHPSDMIPAVLALADPLHTDGRTVIGAIVLAYEVFCRLCDEAAFGPRGWDQGVFSVVGSACAAAKVLGLDREATGQAISLALVPNLPLGVTRVGQLSMWKGCAVASATRAGIFAAQLAQEGMTGPAEPFEGPSGLWETAFEKTVTLDRLGGNGEPFRITATSFKHYPSQIHTQGPIELALKLRSHVSPAEIASVRIRTHRTAVESAGTEPEKWDPQTRETADHSMPYLVAVALRDGAVSPASFTDECVRDPALRPLMARMRIEEDASYTERFPEQANCRMEITSVSGRSFVAETAHPKGHLRNPLLDAEVEAKFRLLAAPVLSDAQRDATLATIWSLDSTPNLDALFESLVVADDRQEAPG
jgi:2-methylcitrate dehydratase